MNKRQRCLRKAAILMASLEGPTADALWEQMSEAQAQRLRAAIAHLDDVNSAERREVIEEFFRIGPLVPGKQACGIELDTAADSGTLQPRSSGDTSEMSRPDERGDVSLRALQEAEPATLVPFLTREHPQTVAVVVSQLTPNRAAEVLAGLPSSLQGDVARRLVDLDETDPEILREVERGLESWLCEQVRGHQRRTEGLEALRSILIAADDEAKHSILANVARHDRQLAAKLHGPVVPQLTFDDVANLETADLMKVLHRADGQVVVLALAGATQELVDRVMAQLSSAEAKTLEYALKHLGPTRLSDVEDAQQELVAVAARVVASGEVAPPSQRLSLAV